jgi:coenzyme F420-0:L-glutamate ligase/coenzyme F420-1:gamma-L-glutamate ligase
MPSWFDKLTMSGVPSMPPMTLDAALAGRRSVRQFSPRPVEPALVEQLIAAACLAPAPHHSRPWRFVTLSAAARAALTDAMGERWRQDLERDGLPEARIRRLLDRSRARLAAAPVLILASVVGEAQRRWPDQRRQRAEELMFGQSLGAAIQSLMLAAHARGLASYWLSAPLFCPEAVRLALDLPSGFEPQALIAIGYPKEGLRLPPRPPLVVRDYIIDR